MHRFQSIKHECMDHLFNEFLTIQSKSVIVWMQTTGKIVLYLAGSLQRSKPQLWDAAFTVNTCAMRVQSGVQGKKNWCTRPKPVNSRKPSACTESEAGTEGDKIANSTSEISLHQVPHVKKNSVVHAKRVPL